MRKSRLHASTLDDSVKDQMAKEYIAGDTCATIAAKHGVSYMFAYTAVKTRTPIISISERGRVVNAEQREKLIADYAAGATCKELAEKYGFKEDSSVWELLKKRGLTRSHTIANRRYELDETVFDDPLSQEAAYWTGFLITDGYIHERPDCSDIIGVNLSARDSSHLEKLKAFLKCDRKVRIYEPGKKSFGTGKMANFYVISEQIGKQLRSHGVTPRKTHTAKASGAAAASPHFWRGCIDGDGSVGLHTGTKYIVPQVKLCGASIDLTNQFSAFCKTYAPGCKAKVSKTCGENRADMFHVCVGGGYAVTLLRILYAGGVALDRKAERSKAILDRRSENPEWCSRRE